MEIELEIKHYLSMPREDRSKTDPLRWWHEKGMSLFPRIAGVIYCLFELRHHFKQTHYKIDITLGGLQISHHPCN